MASRTPGLLTPIMRPVPYALSLRPVLQLRGMPRRPASSSRKEPVTDKSRILEKPARFNPPSHGSRRVRPRHYVGRDLDAEARVAQAARRYPNMMPPEGTFMRWFLTNRGLHLWITLSTLFALAIYSMSLSFLSTTEFRDQLPSSKDWKQHPIQSLRAFIAVYKLHVLHESEKVAEKRRKKIEDADKRKEFLRAHGVEPGFLTGSWMEKFGTVESDQARAAVAAQKQAAQDDRYEASPTAQIQPETRSRLDDPEEAGQRRERKKVKMWFGIW